MSDPALTARPPLGGYDRTIGTVSLAEEAGLALVSAAVPQGGDAAFAAALADGFGATRPATGDSAEGDRHGARVLGMQPDQLFILFEPPDRDRPAETVSAALGAAAYVTDQSDSWAMLRIAGAGVRIALERICPLDLDAVGLPGRPGGAHRDGASRGGCPARRRGQLPADEPPLLRPLLPARGRNVGRECVGIIADASRWLGSCRRISSGPFPSAPATRMPGATSPARAGRPEPIRPGWNRVGGSRQNGHALAVRKIEPALAVETPFEGRDFRLAAPGQDKQPDRGRRPPPRPSRTGLRRGLPCRGPRRPGGPAVRPNRSRRNPR